MQRPGWVTAVGIIGIIIGFFGMLGAGRTIILPSAIQFQEKIISIVYDLAEEEDDLIEKEKTLEISSKIFDLPDWFYRWSIIFGFSSLLVSGFYLFSSIWLLLMKKWAVKFFYIAAGLSILLCIMKTATAIVSGSLIAFIIMGGFSLSIVVNIILIIVVAAGDKTVFIENT